SWPAARSNPHRGAPTAPRPPVTRIFTMTTPSLVNVPVTRDLPVEHEPSPGHPAHQRFDQHPGVARARAQERKVGLPAAALQMLDIDFNDAARGEPGLERDFRRNLEAATLEALPLEDA